MVADSAALRVRVDISSRLQVPGRVRRRAIAGYACLHAAGRKDFSFLGNRTEGESCRHGVAVLESDGLHAGGAAGHPGSAANVQVPVLGKTLSAQGAVMRLVVLVDNEDLANLLSWDLQAVGSGRCFGANRRPPSQRWILTSRAPQARTGGMD